LEGRFFRKAKRDIMELIPKDDREWTIKDIVVMIDHRHGEPLIREALRSLEEEGQLVLRRRQSNVYFYSVK
jgi:hypothetical protein